METHHRWYAFEPTPTPIPQFDYCKSMHDGFAIALWLLLVVVIAAGVVGVGILIYHSGKENGTVAEYKRLTPYFAKSKKKK